MSASRYFESRVTVTIDGDETDVYVRGFVDLEPSRSRGWRAELDGDPDIMINGTWCPIDSVNLGEGDADLIGDALCETALEDDSDCSEEWDEREAAE